MFIIYLYYFLYRNPNWTEKENIEILKYIFLDPNDAIDCYCFRSSIKRTTRFTFLMTNYAEKLFDKI